MKYFPPYIIQWYNLYEKLSRDGYVYIKIKKVMYVLKQAAVLAYNNLVKNISSRGYVPFKYSTGLWWHATKKNCPCVDNSGVKYFSDTKTNHLLNDLQNITTSPCNLKGRTTVDWPLTVITTSNMSTFPCQIAYPNPSKHISTHFPKTSMLCTPQMDSAIIWINHSVWEIIRQHLTSWLKSHQRHTSQGRFINVLLTSTLSNHVTCSKLDSCYPIQTHSSHKNCYWYVSWLLLHIP